MAVPSLDDICDELIGPWRSKPLTADIEYAADAHGTPLDGIQPGLYTEILALDKDGSTSRDGPTSASEVIIGMSRCVRTPIYIV